jgi:hypothetical protein
MRDAVVIPVVLAPCAAPVVDLTQEAPADDPVVIPTAPTNSTDSAPGEDWDSTVDLPVDLTDVEAIREAARVAIASEGIANESIPVDRD